MFDVSSLAAELLDGNPWNAAGALTCVSPSECDSLVSHIIERAGDASSTAAVIDMLLAACPSSPASPHSPDALRRREALSLLAARLAVASVDEDWEDLIPCVSELASSLSFRVQESLVLLVARIASSFFESSRSFWSECLLERDAALAGLVLRGLAASDAPVLAVLELFSAVTSDIRKDVRQNLGPRAIPALGRREPRPVYVRLAEWAAMPDEITRWNVARALATPLGGVYVEDALDILYILAADERPSVWRAAADASVQIAQRRPSYVLPILASWRDDPQRSRAASLALTALARR